MANTNNHAGLEEKGIYDWWVLEYNDPDTKVTSFSFLDLGVGIFNSLPVKNYIKNNMRQLLVTLKGKTGIDLVPNYSREIIPKLFSGEIYGSRTQEEDRGQGLPLIHDRSKNPLIKNFTIISNNVLIKLPSLKITTLKNSFTGTFLYWELHPKN